MLEATEGIGPRRRIPTREKPVPGRAGSIIIYRSGLTDDRALVTPAVRRVPRLDDVMSDEDNVKPYHAKGFAPGQEAADVVAEVLQHAAERDAAAKEKTAPKGPPKWMLPLTVNLGVLALYFLIAQPDFLVLSPVEEPRATAVVAQQARQAIYFEGIERIRRFQEENGRLPSSLQEAGSALEAAGLPVTYTARGNASYVIVVTVGEEPITFDSATDDPQLFAGPINLGG
jgi:hypothetical protein